MNNVEARRASLLAVLAEWACSVAAHPTRGLNPFLVLANGPNAGTSHPAATAAVEIPKLFDIKACLASCLQYGIGPVRDRCDITRAIRPNGFGD